MDQPSKAKLRVVILGAGFGNMDAAKALRHVPVELIIVDRQNHHCFQPLLYQVATASLSPADVAWPIRSILSRQANARVIIAEVTAVDVDSATVVTDATPPISYELLVLGTGATHSYFGHEEWADAAPGLKRIEDATQIRRRLLTAFERAEIEPDPERRRRLLTFVIIGAGPTGVELAGAIADTYICTPCSRLMCFEWRTAQDYKEQPQRNGMPPPHPRINKSDSGGDGASRKQQANILP